MVVERMRLGCVTRWLGERFVKRNRASSRQRNDAIVDGRARALNLKARRCGRKIRAMRAFFQRMREHRRRSRETRQIKPLDVKRTYARHCTLLNFLCACRSFRGASRRRSEQEK